MDPIVIVGSGLAGYTLARELRKQDCRRPLVLVSRDGAEFYSKPLLSNALAQGRSPAQLASADAAAMAEQLQMTVHVRTEVTAIDAGARALQLRAPDGGLRRLDYGDLVLALGADPIRLPLAGDAAGGVLSVNDLSDYTRFREAIAGGRRVLILGAGLIGCEFANDLAAAGHAVAVADPLDRPLGRLLPPGVAAALREGLRGAGVDWRLGRAATAVEAAADGLRVQFDNGGTLGCDVVLSAVGLRPRIALAAAAGLAVGRGIRVDRRLTTSLPGIHALGDCAEVEGLVLPYVMPIMQAARALARTLSGTPTEVAYPPMPVVVKTPACPTVVLPPPPSAQGDWQEDARADGIEARYLDAAGRLLGFALSGAATARKQALIREAPPLLAA